MKKKKFFLVTLSVILTLLVISGITSFASDSSYNVPIKTIYTLSTGNDTPVYSMINGYRYGTIYGTDNCSISSFYSSGWCKVTYPVSNGTKTGYCKTSSFINNINYAQKNIKIQKNAPVYKRSNLSGSAIGTTYTTDTISVVSETSNCYQIIYNVSGGYKCGWINKSYETSGSNSSNQASSGANDSTGSFTYPLKNMYLCGNGWSQYYAVKGRDHVGLDVASSSGNTATYAITNGVIASAGYNSANGNTISVKHTISGKTVYAFYAHLKSINVSVNQVVSKGQQIGVMGNTGGSSTGLHLHFAITTQCSTGTWGYATAFSNNSNVAYFNGYTFYNPNYVLKYSKLP